MFEETTFKLLTIMKLKIHNVRIVISACAGGRRLSRVQIPITGGNSVARMSPIVIEHESE